MTVTIDHPTQVLEVLDDLTRREFIRNLTAIGLIAVAGCASDGVNGQGSSSDAAWTFTDDGGNVVNLPAMPTRIAAIPAAAGALIALGVRPVVIFAGEPFDQEPGLEGLDLTGIESAGNTYGEVNIEKLLELRVDLVVTAFDPLQDGPIFGFVDGPVQGQVEQIAPIVALNGIEDPGKVIRRFEELAVVLGADVQTPQVKASRQRFEGARQALRDAVAGKSGLLALALYASPTDGIYVHRPGQSPATRQFLELGMKIVEPEGEPADINEDFSGFFSEILSLEQADKYPADIFLLDRFEPEDMAAVATWAALPAVKAEQLVGYSALIKWTYDQQADELEAIAAAVRSANPDLV